MISLLYPIRGRLELFKNTINSIVAYSGTIYDLFEVLVLSSAYDEKIANFVTQTKENIDIKYIHYSHPECYNKPVHNPAFAFNLGSNLSKFESIVLTSPEIKHKTPAIKQLLQLVGKNVLCRVEEIDSNGEIIQVLMGTEVPTRHDDPGMYFLGMFNKKDYQSIGGIDEDFMRGLGWEDRDFGRRFKSQYTSTTTDEIVGIHQPHPRYYMYKNLYDINVTLMQKKRAENLIISNISIKMGDTSKVEKIV